MYVPGEKNFCPACKQRKLEALGLSPPRLIEPPTTLPPTKRPFLKHARYHRASRTFHFHAAAAAAATMASRNKGAYENAASDTDFRKKFDRAEYAQQAAEREAKEKEERRLRYEAKLAGKKYYAPLTGEETLTQARASRLDVSSNVGKVMLVPAGAATGKRGRGAGFYCEVCDLTFKDNLQWVEHENSMQHLRAIGQTGEVKRATAEEVRERIDRVWERIIQEKKEDVKTLGERLEVRKEEEEREREERRRKRREQLEKKRLEKENEIRVKREYGEDVRIEGEHDEDDMMASMGITGFGTSKK